jgi:tetratricopeptide (TPR) repeat protein
VELATLAGVWLVRARQAADELAAARARQESEAWCTDRLAGLISAVIGKSPADARTILGEHARWVASPEYRGTALERYRICATLAEAYRALGDWKQAADFWLRAREAAIEEFGLESDPVADSLLLHGDVLRADGRFAEALPLYREALRIAQAVHGDDDVRAAAAHGQLALALCRLDAASAEHHTRRSYEIMMGFLGTHGPTWGHPGKSTAENFMEIAKLHEQAGRSAAAARLFDEAEALHRSALAYTLSTHGEYNVGVSHNLHSLAVLLREHRGQLNESESLLRRALAVRERAYANDPMNRHFIYVTKASLGETLRRLGRFDEAEALLLEAIEKFDPLPDAHLLDVRDEMYERLITLYSDRDAARPGMGYAEKAAEWRQRLHELNPAGGP